MFKASIIGRVPLAHKLFIILFCPKIQHYTDQLRRCSASMQMHQQLMPLIARLFFQIQIIESVTEMEDGVSWDVAPMDGRNVLVLHLIPGSVSMPSLLVTIKVRRSIKVIVSTKRKASDKR